MKLRKTIFSITALILSLTMLSACSSNAATTSPSPVETTLESPTSTAETLNVMALKGPTAMGMVKLIKDVNDGNTEYNYNFSIVGTPDEVVAKVAKGEVDIAAIPCNLASVLYNKTKGGITVTNINTLNVLYILENGKKINSVKDLKGKTIYTLGKGATPEYTLNYILTQNGIDPEKDVNIVYKSESTEVAALLADGTASVAMLPQPYVTTVLNKNSDLRVALNVGNEWDKVKGEDAGSVVTGVLIVRNEVLENNKAAVDAFLASYKDSVEYVNNNVEDAATLVGENDIVPAAIAKLAIPECNITYIDGKDMKDKISGYLKVLYDQNPQSVGGTLPDDNFYYEK